MNKPVSLISPIAAALIVSLGCAAIVPAQAASAPSAEHTTESHHPVTDGWITAKVKSELATTHGVKSMDISVTTVNGVVTLTGVLATDIDVKKAVAAAESIQGVKRVDSSGLKSKS